LGIFHVPGCFSFDFGDFWRGQSCEDAVLLFDQTRQVSEASNVLRGLSFKPLLSSSFARYFRVDDVEPIALFKATRHEQQDAADVL
jgi:hypothetical protein